MSERLPLWVFPALAFSLFVNGLLFLLLPLLTQKGSALPDMTEPVAVNLVRVREEEPPPQEEEPPVPEMEESKETPEFFEPDLLRAEVQPLEMDSVPFRVELNPKLLEGPRIALKRFYEEGEVDHPPTPLVKMPPIYPYKAKRLEVEGFVKVRFLVDEEGTVSRLSIIDSSPKGVFEDSVLQTVPLWKFTPGRIHGESVSSWVVTTIRFELR
jgi:periplasmic protein TonB